MTTLKKSVALAASVALVTWASCAFAADKTAAEEGEEDLTALLSELDGDEGAAKSEKPAPAPAKEAAPAQDEAKAAEAPAEETPVAEAEAPAEEAPAEEEAKAEEAPAAEAPAEEEAKAEEAPAAEAPAEEAPKAEEPAKEEPAAEEAKAGDEPPAADAAKEDSEAEQAADDVLKDVQAEVAADQAKAKETTAEEDAEALALAIANEKIRRVAHEQHAMKLIAEARRLMKEGADYEEAARDYDAALPLLTDTEKLRKFRRECQQGAAEAHYRNALRLHEAGNDEDADAEFELAIRAGHPKAKTEQAAIKAAAAAPKRPESIGEAPHVRNDKAYKDKREKIRAQLRKARQLLGVKDLDGAHQACEQILSDEPGNELYDPYNQDALRLRERIDAKRREILDQEYKITHDAMMTEVSKKWRPIYSPPPQKWPGPGAQTIKAQLGSDPERAIEDAVIKRMKDMRLPEITFKPPATIIEVVEFFNTTTKDLDRPDLPLEKRGFSFVIHTAKPVIASDAPAAEADSDDFSAEAGDEEADAASSATKGMPVIPMISVRDISVYDAMQLVCDTIAWKFKVRKDGIVMVMPKSVSTDEMVTRSYPVLSSFMDRMNTASSDIKEFGGGDSKKNMDADSGGGEQERDWKEFFTLMGVSWPEGSSIMYIKTIGKLRVKNTYENLADLEKALTELNVDQKLIEIETRFVEVCQDDLNSLGFEWILNSDYTIGMDNWLGKALNMQQGSFASGSEKSNILYDGSGNPYGGNTFYNVADETTATSGSSWKRASSLLNANSPVYDSYGNIVGYNSLDTGTRNMGISSFGGTDAEFGNTSRYLSTTGNHITKTMTGEANLSQNDQFMKVNAFLGNADLSMILHMLSQRSDTDLLSAPKVLTRPGEEAVIKIVTEYIYPTDYDVQLQSSSSSSGSSGSSSQSAILAVVEPQSFTMREVGVILAVTPTLTDDGNLIDLKLSTQVVDEPTWKDYGMKIPYSGNSSLTSFEGIGEIFTGVSEIFTALGLTLDDDTKNMYAAAILESSTTAMNNLTAKTNIEYYKAAMEQPWFHVRSIESAISISPGATIAMGGLITEKRAAMDDKIPFLGDIPFIGRLFRSHAEETSKRNLIIFVTTRLINVSGREVTRNTDDVKPVDDASSAPTTPAPSDDKAEE